MDNEQEQKETALQFKAEYPSRSTENQLPAGKYN